MNKSQTKKLFWNEAATCGLVMGIIYTAILYIEYFYAIKISSTGSQIYSMVQIGIYIALIYLAQRRYRNKRGDLGLTYGQSLGFGTTVMSFAGVIYGLGYFFMFNYVATDYFIDIIKEASRQAELAPEIVEESIALTMQIYKDPITCVLSVVMSSAMTGAFVSLIVSIYTRRRAVLPETQTDKESL